MKKKYEDIFELKNELWQMRLNKCSGVKTEKWTKKDVHSVLKKLKKN